MFDMTTPNREQIYSKAKQLYVQSCYRSGSQSLGDVNPTYEELAESGFVVAAQSELMCSDSASVYGVVEPKTCKSEIEEDNDLDSFPIDLIMKEGCVVVGGRGCGKTNLLKLLVSEALRRKVDAKLFDPSLAWKGFPLPTIKVKDGKHPVESRYNTIYDVSRLSVLEVRKFVSETMSRDLTESIYLTDLGKKPTCVFFIEEAQNIIPSNTLRLLRFQDVSRFVSQGRNFGLTYVASTQRLARVDVDLVEISGVKYWFKLEGERNLTKARWWLSKYRTWSLRELEVGQCYLQIGNRVKLLRLPLFETEKVEVTCR